MTSERIMHVALEGLDTGMRLIVESFTSRTHIRYLAPLGAPTRGSQIFNQLSAHC